jgi:hypothetical protein
MFSRSRARSGDLNQSPKRLKVTLKYTYNPTLEFLICGDNANAISMQNTGDGHIHVIIYIHFLKYLRKLCTI